MTRRTPRIEDFLEDDGRLYVRVGDLQLLSELLDRLRSEGAEGRIIAAVEELIPKIENSLALLLELIEERMPPVR